MSKPKTLALLVGPKGSGKTTIGKLLEKEGCVFLEVEKLFMEVIAAGTDNIIERALRRVEKEVADLLIHNDTVIMESTAAQVDFPALVDNYKALFGRVVLIRIRVPLDTCVQRCYSRDQTNQIQVTREALLSYYEETERVQMSWDLVVDNDGTEFDSAQILTRCAELF